MPELCYRALIYIPHQLELWNAGKFNSRHPSPHPGWAAIWGQKEEADPGAEHDPADFPLEFDAGRYTEQAKMHYLQFMRDKGGEDWTDEELLLASELDGVCAFDGEDGPRRAYEYAASSDLPEDVALIVTFMGEVVCDLPEDGGVLAMVVDPMCAPMTATEFRELHGLDPYHKIQPEEVDLFAGYDVEDEEIDENKPPQC